MNPDDKLSFIADSIKKAKAVMDKVEGNDYGKKRNDATNYSINERDNDAEFQKDMALLSEEQMSIAKNKGYPLKNMATSKMPEAILKSFAENPIIDPTQPIGHETIMQEIVKKAAPVIKESRQPQKQETVTTVPLDTKLIEYIIKKTVEETVEYMTKKTNVDENIVIKIGNKSFSGKIATLIENKIKK